MTDDTITVDILSNTFTRRPDISKSVIRAIEGRKFLKMTGGTILPDNSPIERNFGDITIDNANFGRYAGEIQIVDDVLPADERVNVIARILPEEIFMTGYIKPGQKFIAQDNFLDALSQQAHILQLLSAKMESQVIIASWPRQ